MRKILISIFTVLTFGALDAVHASNSLTHEGHIDKLEPQHRHSPNNRGRPGEGNRDISTSFQHGLVQGLLKVSQSGNSDCAEGGLSMMRDTYAVCKEFYERGFNMTDQMYFMNCMEFYQITSSKCNYMSTLQGVILTHHLKKHLNEGGFVKKQILSRIFRFFAWQQNMSDDAYVIMNAMISLAQHKDLFDAGLLAGKASKLAVEAYLDGWLTRAEDSQNDDKNTL